MAAECAWSPSQVRRALLSMGDGVDTVQTAEIKLLDLHRRPRPGPAAIAAARIARRRALYGPAAHLDELDNLVTVTTVARRNREFAVQLGRLVGLDPAWLYQDGRPHDPRSNKPHWRDEWEAAGLVRSALSKIGRQSALALDAERLARIRGGNVISIVAAESYFGDLIAAGDAPEVAAALNEKLGTDLADVVARKLAPRQLPWGGTAQPAELGGPRTSDEAMVAAGYEAGWNAIIRLPEQGLARAECRATPLDEPKDLPAQFLRRMRIAPGSDRIVFGRNDFAGFDVRVIWIAALGENVESAASLRPAPEAMVREEARTLYDDREVHPPNIVEAEREIRARMDARGYRVSKDALRRILGEAEFAELRRPAGKPLPR